MRIGRKIEQRFCNLGPGPPRRPPSARSGRSLAGLGVGQEIADRCRERLRIAGRRPSARRPPGRRPATWSPPAVATTGRPSQSRSTMRVRRLRSVSRPGLVSDHRQIGGLRELEAPVVGPPALETNRCPEPSPLLAPPAACARRPTAGSPPGVGDRRRSPPFPVRDRGWLRGHRGRPSGSYQS